jgi:hypothetical protein
MELNSISCVLTLQKGQTITLLVLSFRTKSAGALEMLTRGKKNKHSPSKLSGRKEREQ